MVSAFPKTLHADFTYSVKIALFCSNVKVTGTFTKKIVGNDPYLSIVKAYNLS